jgi:hypothetical protein
MLLAQLSVVLFGFVFLTVGALARLTARRHAEHGKEEGEEEGEEARVEGAWVLAGPEPPGFAG